MKTKEVLLLVCLFIFGQTAFSQKDYSCVSYFLRGHSTDDLYIRFFSDPSDATNLFYFNNNGNKLLLKNPDWNYGFPVTENIIGKLISVDYGGYSLWYESNDFGRTKGSINWFPDENVVLEVIFGGEFPGDYIIQARNFSYSYPFQYENFRTNNYGTTYTLIDDSVAAFHNPEVGSLQGEMYELPIIVGHGYICRSTDYSHTFDTTAIDTTVLNSNTGLFFNTLSHGATAGDLFLVTKEYDGADTLFHIYHSTDYGHSWQQKSNQIINDPDVKFTAGRAPCSFYIAHSHLNDGDEYNTLYIKYSNDCGATFTTYTYLMTPDVANKKPDKAESFASVLPNPANDVVQVQFATDTRDVSIKILNPEGKSVESFDKISSAKNFSFGVSSLPAGIYFVQFYENKTLKQTSKLIVTNK